MISTDAEYIFFMSSSGHCTFDCSYCIIDPIAKHQPSLTIDDLNHLLDTVGGKSALLFSGKGDFFAGYKKGEDLLSRLLERNVDVALDINGVIIHEFRQLCDEKASKIKHINLTMHYTQILRKNALSAWKSNARFIIQRRKWESFLMNTVISPHDLNIWDEILKFYDEQIFAETGSKITLIRDTLNWNETYEEQFEALSARFKHIIAETRHVDFASLFEGKDLAFCPAGKEYFRVWNDGQIEGCPYVGELANLGNAKERNFLPRKNLFECTHPRYCDCSHIHRLGKMRYPEG